MPLLDRGPILTGARATVTVGPFVQSLDASGLTHVIGERLNKQIAGDLGLVEKTIKVHRGRVMGKLGGRTVVDLVSIAEKAGIRDKQP
jgi:hypothetical protein